MLWCVGGGVQPFYCAMHIFLVYVHVLCGSVWFGNELFFVWTDFVHNIFQVVVFCFLKYSIYEKKMVSIQHPQPQK